MTSFVRCTCGVMCPSDFHLQQHLLSPKHRANIAELQNKENNGAPISKGVQNKISKIVQDEGKKILLDDILLEYEARHGKRPFYTGKFKSHLEQIPGVKIENNYATWVGSTPGLPLPSLKEKLVSADAYGEDRDKKPEDV